MSADRARHRKTLRTNSSHKSDVTALDVIKCQLYLTRIGKITQTHQNPFRHVGAPIILSRCHFLILTFLYSRFYEMDMAVAGLFPVTMHQFSLALTSNNLKQYSLSALKENLDLKLGTFYQLACFLKMF